ncbi:MAG: hypothetical protein DWI00_08270 [Planctomycetota bacterium]|nr:MAG: hypothetical protein DWI00_08270 [Planctomycetota bacterium]
MKQTVILVTLAMVCGCRSDVAQQDAMELARSKGADIRISIKGDAHRVDLRRCTFDSDVKSAIRNMPAIDTLLIGKAFTDADAELVEGLVSLKNLDLSRSTVTAATFERLTGLRQLEFLALNDLILSDQDMEAISKLRQLKAISLVDAKCSEEALQRFTEQNPDCTIAR